MTLDGKPSFHQWKCLSFIYKEPAGVAALMAGFSFALIPPAFRDIVRDMNRDKMAGTGRKQKPPAPRMLRERLNRHSIRIVAILPCGGVAL